MNAAKVERVLKQLAEKEGVSVKAVRHKIEIAIAEGRKSADPKAQAFWQSIPHKGECPTSEEVILHLAGLTKE